MNAPKPKESLAGQTCPCCQQGRFALVQIDYIEQVADDKLITVPGVWVERCDHCRETVYPGETTRFIESKGQLWDGMSFSDAKALIKPAQAENVPRQI
jgi:hypothetical protein